MSKFLISLRYESYTTMYVKNNNSAGADVNPNANVDLNDLNTAKSLAATYITVLKSQSVMEQVGERLQEKYTVEELSGYFIVRNKKISLNSLSNSFTMSSVDGTEVIKITANTLNPAVSADLCNIMADIAPSFLIRIVGAGSVEIIDVARPVEKPVSPNIPLTTVIGIIIGFSVSVLIVLLVDYFDDTIKEGEELTDRFNKAMLGEVEELESDIPGSKKKKKKETGRQRKVLLTDDNIPFHIVESYKSIRSNILFSLGTTSKRVIAVSSPNPSEGKSTSASNIAIALAQTGSRVLLIDADLRKPVQHKTFKVSNSEGLSTLIIQRSDFDSSVKKNVATNLDLLPSGPMPPNPSELLVSDQFRSIIEKVSSEYEFVVIDTPPSTSSATQW